MKSGLALAVAVLIAGSVASRRDAIGFAFATHQTTPPLVITSMYGRDLFEFYCASCHGRDGKGHGPVASRLKNPPPDLTTLAKGSGGTFPRDRVESSITGDVAAVAPSHGSREMPVWGPILRSLDPSHDSATKVRIANLIDHIESIQSR